MSRGSLPCESFSRMLAVLAVDDELAVLLFREITTLLDRFLLGAVG